MKQITITTVFPDKMFTNYQDWRTHISFQLFLAKHRSNVSNETDKQLLKAKFK
jgi:hypothetical protein